MSIKLSDPLQTVEVHITQVDPCLGRNVADLSPSKMSTARQNSTHT